MQNTDKGNNRVDREILPSSAGLWRKIKVSQGDSHWEAERWEQAVRAQLSKAQQPGPASPGQRTGKSRHEPSDLGLEGIPVAVRLRLKPSAEIIKGTRIQ